MLSSTILMLTSALLPADILQDVGDCTLACLHDTTSTNCDVAHWPCLCQDQGYLVEVMNCVSSQCTEGEYRAAMATLPQLCAIFGMTPTAQESLFFPTTTSPLSFSTVEVTPHMSDASACRTTSTSGSETALSISAPFPPTEQSPTSSVTSEELATKASTTIEGSDGPSPTKNSPTTSSTTQAPEPTSNAGQLQYQTEPAMHLIQLCLIALIAFQL